MHNVKTIKELISNETFNQIALISLCYLDNAERSPSKKDSPSGNRTKKEAMDTLTSIAITTAVASGVSGK
jgi:hypothetical protein